MTGKVIFQKLRNALRLSRSLRITATGWKFLALTLIVGFAAVNTANNLLYLIFGLMLSFITVSGILSELMLRKLHIQRHFPKHIFAGQAIPVTVTLTNQKRHIASFSLLVEDYSQTRPVESRRYVLKIAARQTVSATYPVTFAQRGLNRPGKIRISTRYPFGFFIKSATFVETEDDVLVYPAIEPVSSRRFLGLTTHIGDASSLKKGSGTEIHAIREYIQGDSHARIHWKTTAKQAKLMTKEFEEERKKRVAIFLAIPEQHDSAEQAISLAASYARHFIHLDFQTQVFTAVQQSLSDRGQRHLFRILRMLAVFQAGVGDNQRLLSNAARLSRKSGALNILISVSDSEKGDMGRNAGVQVKVIV